MTASAPLLIFIATYLLIAVQPVRFLHLNRPAASLLGAVAMVVLGGLPLPEAYAAIDLDVLVFLLGLMILVGYLEEGGFFEVAAKWLLERVTTPRRLLVGVVLGSGVLSALFVNDTICLVVTPVLVATLGSLGVRPAPYLITLAMGANVGSLLAFTGNPQNMLIGLWSGIPFARFSLHMLPLVAGGLVLTCAVLVAIYWRELDRPFPRRAELPPVTFDRALVLTALLLFRPQLLPGCWGATSPLSP